MKLYHGTTKENWDKIKKEGILWGIRGADGFCPDRCTYFAIKKEHARVGINQDEPEILLEVDYDVEDGASRRVCSLGAGDWQYRIYEPIPIEKVKLPTKGE